MLKHIQSYLLKQVWQKKKGKFLLMKKIKCCYRKRYIKVKSQISKIKILITTFTINILYGLKKRDDLREFLTKNKIGTEIYYPVPFHLQECFSNLGYKQGEFPDAEMAANTSVALPIYPELTKEQLGYVVEKITEFFRS